MIDVNTPLVLNVTAGEMQLLMNALQELPFRLSAPVIGKLEQQIREQAPGAFAEMPAQALNGSAPVVNGDALA